MNEHLDPINDIAAGFAITVGGIEQQVYSARDDYCPTGARLKQWRDSEWLFSPGTRGGAHDIVYINADLSHFIRVTT